MKKPKTWQVVTMVGILCVLALVLSSGSIPDASPSSSSQSNAEEDPTDIRTKNTAIFVIAQEIVEDNLKAPSTAEFCRLSECTMQRYDNLYAATGYVDAENGFGAMIRSEWTVQFYSDDLRSYAYQATYIAIDDQAAGEWVDFPEA